jgi:hypothetical protein
MISNGVDDVAVGAQQHGDVAPAHAGGLGAPAGSP